jgi:hypothetical protein
MTGPYKIRYLDAHSGREVLSPPEASLADAVSFAQKLELGLGCAIRAIVYRGGEIGWAHARELMEAAERIKPPVG